MAGKKDKKEETGPRTVGVVMSYPIHDLAKDHYPDGAAIAEAAYIALNQLGHILGSVEDMEPALDKDGVPRKTKKHNLWLRHDDLKEFAEASGIDPASIGMSRLFSDCILWAIATEKGRYQRRFVVRYEDLADEIARELGKESIPELAKAVREALRKQGVSFK